MKTISITRHVDFRTIYTNAVRISCTAFDLGLLCSVQEPTAEGMKEEEVLRLMMSLPHAKALSRFLAETLHNFEQQFGLIREVPVVLEPKERGQ